MADGAVDLILGLAEGEHGGVDHVRLRLALRELQRLRREAREEGALGVLTGDERGIEGFGATVVGGEDLEGLEAVAAGDGAGDGRTGVTAVGEELVLPLGLVLVLVVHVVEDIDRGVLGHLALEAEEADRGDDRDGEECEVTGHGGRISRG